MFSNFIYMHTLSAVAPLNHYDPPRVLNYLTAPHVCVWSAAVASCAIPGIFDSTPLYVKEPNGDYRPEHEWSRQGTVHCYHLCTQCPHTAVQAEEVSAKAHAYSDGSFENDLPMAQISELFNVNHFIVSQGIEHLGIL